MKLTKYKHACLVVEEQGHKLVVDPGTLTPDFGASSAVVAIVVTHEHFDHMSKDHLQALARANPSLRIFAPEDAAQKLAGLPVTVVKAGDRHTVGPFSLQFFGDLHAQIHALFPRCKNVGVLINNNLYYPGDSFTLPNLPVKNLALPVSGPWLKVGEAIDFLDAVKPQLAFPTHEAMLSETGIQMFESWTKQPDSQNPLDPKK